eukprot:135460-Chlamydomonas_euryale.AAC.1
MAGPPLPPLPWQGRMLTRTASASPHHAMLKSRRTLVRHAQRDSHTVKPYASGSVDRSSGAGACAPLAPPPPPAAPPRCGS